MNSFNKLIKVLQTNNHSDAEIALIVREIAQKSAMELYSYMLSLIGKEDWSQLIQHESSEREQDKLITDVFSKNSQQTMSEKLQEIQSDLIETFLETYREE